MKLQTIHEAKYAGNPRAAIESIKNAIQNEQDFINGEDDEEEQDRSYELMSAYEQIIDWIKNGQLKTSDDLAEVGDLIYNATGSGDTDLASNTQHELARLLSIRDV